ncbi:hypothetical protein BKA65DRAFT_484846 [Rhexocercosporidium sp. MPI-PUGE-AT-0058]|nr:hypothetical protein BKA65DRAFT_484846 [Rhexocercosporidium sp. MPI-PUGE-AT-0058]
MAATYLAVVLMLGETFLPIVVVKSGSWSKLFASDATADAISQNGMNTSQSPTSRFSFSAPFFFSLSIHPYISTVFSYFYLARLRILFLLGDWTQLDSTDIKTWLNLLHTIIVLGRRRNGSYAKPRDIRRKRFELALELPDIPGRRLLRIKGETRLQARVLPWSWSLRELGSDIYFNEFHKWHTLSQPKAIFRLGSTD